MIYICLFAFLLGFPISWSFARYIKCVNDGNALKAAGWDTFMMICSHLGALTLWAKSDDSVLVLISYIIGTAIGTYLVVSRNKNADL